MTKLNPLPQHERTRYQPGGTDASAQQSARADEFVAVANCAIAREPLKGNWEVPLQVDISAKNRGSNSLDAGAARWASQRFSSSDSGYTCELIENPQAPWILKIGLLEESLKSLDTTTTAPA